MSYDPQSGLRDAIQDVLEGIIVSAVLGIIPLIPNVPSYYVGIIQLFEAMYLIGGILVILAMERWKFGYLLGWLLGMWIMSSTGFVESWLFTLYIIVGVVVLILKVLRKLGSSG
jgi:hypothetical protein